MALALLLLVPLPPSDSAPTDPCVSVAVDLAYERKDSGALEALADISQSSTSSLERHRAAYALYRLSLLRLVSDDKREAKKLAKRGLKLLDRLEAPSPDDLALMGALYSVRIRTSTMSAIFLGKKSEKLVDRGLAIQPDNPRALLTKATAVFFKPGTFGGGVDKAAPLIQRTEAAFAQAVDGAAVCWGSADLVALSARLAHAKNDEPEAQRQLDALRTLAATHPELDLLRADGIE